MIPPVQAALAVKMSVADLKNGAASLNCELAALRAVMSVESRASGFDGKNRPIILFEPHIFYRNLHDQAQRDRAVAEGLAYPHWGEHPYPASSDGNYDRLNRARAINAEAAFRSVSIGLGQILGENFEQVGCASAHAMFDAARQSEANQLSQMVAFIKANKLDGFLRLRQWASFAERYNGPGYRKNAYDEKLATAYQHWRRVT